MLVPLSGLPRGCSVQRSACIGERDDAHCTAIACVEGRCSAGVRIAYAAGVALADLMRIACAAEVALADRWRLGFDA